MYNVFYHIYSLSFHFVQSIRTSAGELLKSLLFSFSFPSLSDSFPLIFILSLFLQALFDLYLFFSHFFEKNELCCNSQLFFYHLLSSFHLFLLFLYLNLCLAFSMSLLHLYIPCSVNLCAFSFSLPQSHQVLHWFFNFKKTFCVVSFIFLQVLLKFGESHNLQINVKRIREIFHILGARYKPWILLLNAVSLTIPTALGVLNVSLHLSCLTRPSCTLSVALSSQSN